MCLFLKIKWYNNKQNQKVEKKTFIKNKRNTFIFLFYKPLTNIAKPWCAKRINSRMPTHALYLMSLLTNYKNYVLRRVVKIEDFKHQYEQLDCA